MIHRLLFAFTICITMMVTTNAFTSSRRVLKGASPAQKTVTILAAAKKSAKDDEVVNFKKAEFVAAVAEKTGMTKGESEKALSAVLNIIATVSLLLLCSLFVVLSTLSDMCKETNWSLPIDILVTLLIFSHFIANTFCKIKRRRLHPANVSVSRALAHSNCPTVPHVRDATLRRGRR